MEIKRMARSTADGGAEPVARKEQEQVLELLLASPLFAKSRRMGSLLRFLAEHGLQHADTPLSEHAIGLAVFRRDPTVYCTSQDPVVRVQIGRLRRKLSIHYTTLRCLDPVRLSVPAGSYRVTYQRFRPGSVRHSVVQIHPFASISHDGDAFTLGLCEELSCRLFESFEQTRTFTRPVLMKGLPERLPRPGRKRLAVGNYSLEGSVRVEPARVRTSVRLIDEAQGRIRWSAQFDRQHPYGIAAQVDLAESICQSLTLYFASGGKDEV